MHAPHAHSSSSPVSSAPGSTEASLLLTRGEGARLALSSMTSGSESESVSLSSNTSEAIRLDDAAAAVAAADPDANRDDAGLDTGGESGMGFGFAPIV